MCGTIIGKARAMMALSIESIGYEKYFRRLFEKVGVEYDEATVENLKRLDTDQEKQNKYHKSKLFLQKQAQNKAKRVREEVQKEKNDREKGKRYGHGIAAPVVTTKNESYDGKMKF